MHSTMQRFLCGTVLLSCLLSCLVLVGCGPSPADVATKTLTGKWEADPMAGIEEAIAEQVDANPMANPIMKGFANQLAQHMKVNAKFEAVFRKTGTMTLTLCLGEKRKEMGSGNWTVTKVDGKRIVIDVTDLDNKNPQVYQITLVDDDHVKFKPPNGNQELTFARVKE